MRLSYAAVASGAIEEADRLARQVLNIAPNRAGALTVRGLAAATRNELGPAHGYLSRAVEHQPKSVEALRNLAQICIRMGDAEGAVEAYRKALEVRPGSVDCHMDLGCGLLFAGDFKEGWKHYEIRNKRMAPNFEMRALDEPYWNGESLDGKTLLIHWEQGHGDTIMMARFVPMIAHFFGVKIKFVVQPHLASIMQSLEGPTTDNSMPAIEIFGGSLDTDADRDAIGPFDYWCRAMSLPYILGTTLKTLPPPPYLWAHPSQVDKWHASLPKAKKRVGLVWRGNPNHKRDSARSATLEQLAPLFAMKDVAWVSLQKGPDIVADLARGMAPGLFVPGLNDFADTAAAIEALDLVVTVDTAVAHLAGALHKPVWIMIPQSADFRWLPHRTDSPWYPSARLYRQANEGDWSDVVSSIVADLNNEIA